MEEMIETLLNVGWILSLIALLTLMGITTKRAGWGADDAKEKEAQRAARPYLWATATVGLLCLLGLIITRHL